MYSPIWSTFGQLNQWSWGGALAVGRTNRCFGSRTRLYVTCAPQMIRWMWRQVGLLLRLPADELASPRGFLQVPPIPPQPLARHSHTLIGRSKGGHL